MKYFNSQFLLNLCLVLFTATTLSCSDDDNTRVGSTGGWEGIFTGGDTGTLTFTIANDNTVSGTLVQDGTGITTDFTGTVTDEGVLFATSGTTTTGTILNGQIEPQISSGTWENTFTERNGIWRANPN